MDLYEKLDRKPPETVVVLFGRVGGAAHSGDVLAVGQRELTAVQRRLDRVQDRPAGVVVVVPDVDQHGRFVDVAGIGPQQVAVLSAVDRGVGGLAAAVSSGDDP